MTEQDKDFHTGVLPEKEAHRQRRIRSASKFADESTNPCMKESELSLSCMSENAFDREKCMLYFKNYRNCLDFWKRVKNDRRKRGIEPLLPPPDQRQAVRDEYYKMWAYQHH